MNKGTLRGVGKPAAGEIRYGCRLRRTAAETCGDATPTAISWQIVDEDPAGFIVAPSVDLTVPTGGGGIYVCHFLTDPADVAYTSVELYLTRNTIRVAAAFYGAFTGVTASRLHVGYAGVLLLPGDKLQAQVNQDSAGAQSFIGSELYLFRIGS